MCALCHWMVPVSTSASVTVESSTVRLSMLEGRHSMSISQINVKSTSFETCLEKKKAERSAN